MKKTYIKFVIIFFLILLVDQFLKDIFIKGYRYYGEFFSLILTYNDGVAFSMLRSFGASLKYLQILLLVGIFTYLLEQREFLKENTFAFALILGAGASNLLDRFLHKGVVDYVFWHKYFEFAVFNFADVMIDLGIFIILLKQVLAYFKKKKREKNAWF